MTFTVNGETVTVARGKGPSADAYLFATIRGKEYFVAPIVPGMTRADVRLILTDHPQFARTPSAPLSRSLTP